jgi:predicted secreted hydrolase
LLGLLGVVFTVGCSRGVQPLPAAPLPSPTAPAPISFPRDAAPHQDLTEWWYFTGHLQTAAGHQYGFEFTIFQVNRQDEPTGYLGHFAISDVSGGRFSFATTFAPQPRPATSFPLAVNGWQLDHDASGDTLQAAMPPGPTADPAYALQLRVTDEKPPALHHGGYIEDDPAGGSAYYSRTRLDASGQLGVVGGPSEAVSGIAWMDHQWGNFVVPARGGWDWYSLQLDDQTELMLYVLRDASGATSAVYGTQVLPDGSTHDLAAGDVTAEATGSWTSPHTGAVYPSGWQLALWNGKHLVLQPQLQDQELYFPDQSGLAYWEGAVTVSGDQQGLGYVELTGYAP